MRLIGLCLAVVLLAGCLQTSLTEDSHATPPLVHASAASGVSKSQVRFESVGFIPSEPRSGQEVLVRTYVHPPGFAQPPFCRVMVGGDGMRGGGLSWSGPMTEISSYAYECLVPPVEANDFVAVLLVAHDGETWVRSDLHVLRTPDGPSQRRPASTIADFRVEETAEKAALRAVVDLDVPALASPLHTTIGGVQFERLPRDHNAFFGMGLRLEPTELGRLEASYPLAYPQGNESTEAGRDPDFVLLGYAYTYNTLGGFDITGLLEYGHGECATASCVRT